LLRAFNLSQLQSAGARYTPGIDPNAPNLEIMPLLRAIHCISCGSELIDELNSFVTQLNDKWNLAKRCCEDSQQLQSLVEQVSIHATAMVQRIRGGNSKLLDKYLEALKMLESILTKEFHRIRHLEEEIAENNRAKAAGATETAYSSGISEVRASFNSVQDVLSVVNSAIEDYSESNGQLISNGVALLSGLWGTGKTHLLCDVTRHRMGAQRPTLLILAKNFQTEPNVLRSIAAKSGISDDIRIIIAHLDELGARADERALILVDGVNEGPRKAWSKAVDELVALVDEHQNVSLLVSCRSPFEEVTLSAYFRAKAVHREHRGFDEQEFNAQAEFFHYYKVPLPEVPLLSEEFSRPLTLKLICEAFRDLRTTKQKAGFAGLASGQKGMTYVLETFVNRVSQPIENEFRLPQKSIWLLLKGSDVPIAELGSGFAPTMAHSLKEYVGRRTALRIIRQHFPELTARQRMRLIERMRTSGLIDEDSVWGRGNEDGKYSVVYRLPYQRFSDHLIARHLLARYLNKKDPTSIAQSFSGQNPLSRVFSVTSKWHGYSKPGWAEALIAEFPESTKRTITDEAQRELYFFLPKRSQNLNHYYKPFLSGLFWRSPQAFSDATNQLINAFLTQGSEDMWRGVIDALVALAIKPNHPYPAERLYRYLASFSIVDRDLKWSEYLRRTYSATSVRRLSRWIETVEIVGDLTGFAKQLIVLLSLLLVTVDRAERDLVTYALVVIGEKHPRLLFDHVITTLSFNDPYVSERMLAAAYGTALSQWQVMRNEDFHEAFGNFARHIFDQLFAPNAPHATHHVLARDYALGIVQIGLRLDSAVVSTLEMKYLAPPYAHIRSVFPPIDQITDADIADGKSAIHMDFGNYTMGRLIVDRRNYDDEHRDYKDVRRQIEWRIGNLGYREDKFSTIDKMIGSSNYLSHKEDGEKCDRYGKKYSWIAYFEMYGLREANRKLKEWRLGERTSDCDIDPSFPKEPRENGITIPNLPRYAGLSDEQWLSDGPAPDYTHLLRLPVLNNEQGHWILLDGYIAQEEVTHIREVFTFTRGVFVSPAKVAELRDKYESSAYPGNDEIPSSARDIYAYAGEIGMQDRYCRHSLDKNGKYKRFTEKAFEVWQRTPGVKVEIPTRSFEWESYHSKMNQVSAYLMPTPRMIQELGLHLRGREIDFFDQNGRIASQYVKAGEGHRGNQHQLLYLREDLLQKYLSITRQTLVWMNWGERDWVNKGGSGSKDPRPAAVFQCNQNIHKRFTTYKELSR
jgi:hypothetical protein